MTNELVDGFSVSPSTPTGFAAGRPLGPDKWRTHTFTLQIRKRKGIDIDRKKGKVEVGEQGRRESEKRVCSNN